MKWQSIISCLILWAIPFVVSSQTPSNDCSTLVAQQLTVGTSCSPVTYNISSAIGSPAPVACNTFLAIGNDGWGWFTATSTMTIIQYTNTNRDAQILLYSGTCASLTLIACADSYVTGTETISASTVIGQTYFVRIMKVGTTGASMSGTICLFNAPIPSNDACSNATPISCGQTLSGTTIGASTETVPASCYYDNNSPSVWYTFVGNGNNVLLSLCSGTSFDTQLSIFTGTCASLTCLGVNDNGCALQSQALFTSLIGVTYYVRVSGYGSTQGTFSLAMTCTTPAVANDGCSAAPTLTCGQTVTGNTTGALPDIIPSACYNSNSAPGVWYKYVGTGANTTFSLCGSSFDTQIAVLTGSCTAFSCNGYNDDGCSTQSTITINAVAGVTYYIYVFGYLSASGAYTLTVTCAAPPPPPCTSTDPNGCPSINAGSNLNLPVCNVPCTPIPLTANYFEVGQTTSYQVCSIPYSPYPYNTGTGFSIGTDDVWTPSIPLPFNFCFFGVNYSSCVVGSNGLISFNPAYASAYCPYSFSASCPSASLPLNCIYGVYHDIDPSVYCGASLCGDARYATFGTSPCRVFVVSYDNLAHFSSLCNQTLFTSCEIVLYETTNVIEVFVENKPTCLTWNSGNALIGIQNATGLVGFSPPSRNTGPWAASLEGWRFIPSGTSTANVVWTQNGTQIGTGVTVNVCPSAPSQTYVATATYTKCDGSTVVVSDDVVVTCSAIVLPIEWISFEVKPDVLNKSAHLTWATASEKENDHFTVERSANGMEWIELGRLSGSGTSLTEHHYQFFDYSPLSGTSYYRIKQTDTNGAESYSDVRALDFHLENQVRVFPIPADDFILLEPWYAGSKARLIDVKGKSIECEVSSNGQIKVDQIQAGAFILEVERPTGEKTRASVIIQH